MRTFQDWQDANTSEESRMQFITAAINDYKQSKEYKEAKDGEAYFDGENTTIKRYEKILFNALGQAVPDLVSANHKLATRFFFRDVTQANSVLLGNGITWSKNAGGDALGKKFDAQAIEAARIAQVQGAAFAFYNNGTIHIYERLQFIPLMDEEDGSIKAGIRFWQIDDSKPMRVTMYEMDGFEEYQFDNGKGSIKQEKRAYIIEKGVFDDGTEEIYNESNYPTFPIVPLYANDKHRSELIPLRPKIDCRDLISSGYANSIDDASIIYWTITNSGGMDDADLVQMIDKLRKLHATQLDGDVNLESHSVEPSYQGREAILTRLDEDLYKDSMMLDTYSLASGAVTATQIIAAYEPLNEKLDIFESHITSWIMDLLELAGVEDMPTYERSIVVNKSEEIQNVVNSAMYLDPEYVTEKIVTLLGDKDQLSEIEKGIATNTLDRFANGSTGE